MARTRKARRASDYNRRGPQREPYDSVLIVCEGLKTEPNYLEGIRQRYRLSNANIKIIHPKGTNPLSIVAAAEDGLANDEFDRAFCVFDRDGHTDFDKAIARISNHQLKKGNRLQAITSVPCFELWILLHYEFTTSGFTASGNNSPCDKVIDRLRSHMPDYRKGKRDFVPFLLEKLDSAMKNSERLFQYNKETGSLNPMTAMHDLIAYLQTLK